MFNATVIIAIISFAVIDTLAMSVIERTRDIGAQRTRARRPPADCPGTSSAGASRG